MTIATVLPGVKKGFRRKLGLFCGFESIGNGITGWDYFIKGNKIMVLGVGKIKALERGMTLSTPVMLKLFQHPTG